MYLPELLLEELLLENDGAIITHATTTTKVTIVAIIVARFVSTTSLEMIANAPHQSKKANSIPNEIVSKVSSMLSIFCYSFHFVIVCFVFEYNLVACSILLSAYW